MEKLGIQPSLLLAQIVNFTIIMVVLTKLLYKPMLGMLEKRRKKIEEGLRLTESMKEEEGSLDVKRQKVLDQARKEGQDIIEESKKRAKEEEKQMLIDARSEADDIIVKGHTEVERLKKDMQKAMEKDTIELSTVMAERLLSEVMTKDLHHEVIENHLKKLRTLKK
jgi:F-type H+-transporting ATPase subunit b